MSDSEPLYIIEQILDKKYSSSQQAYVYFVKWEGFTSDDNTWEPEDNLSSVPGLLEKFNQEWERRQSKNNVEDLKRLERNATLRKRRADQRQQKLTIGTKKIKRGPKIGEESEPNKRKKIEKVYPKDLQALVNTPPDSPISKDKYSKTSQMEIDSQINPDVNNQDICSEKEKSLQSSEEINVSHLKNNEERSGINAPFIESITEHQELDKNLANKSPKSDNSSDNMLEVTTVPFSSELCQEEQKKEFNYNFSVQPDRPDFKTYQPAKIIGCRKFKEGVYYAVLFKARKDGSISSTAMVPHPEMVIKAPALLSEYLMDNMIIS